MRGEQGSRNKLAYNAGVHTLRAAQRIGELPRRHGPSCLRQGQGHALQMKGGYEGLGEGQDVKEW